MPSGIALWQFGRLAFREFRQGRDFDHGEVPPDQWHRRLKPFRSRLERARPLRRTGDDRHTKRKGLILAQNERWRRGLGMQVERKGPSLLGHSSGERESNA